MTVQQWLDLALSDVRRRNLPPLEPLLEGLAGSLQALRAAAEGLDVDGYAAGAEAPADTPSADAPTGPVATDRPAASHALPSIEELTARLTRGDLKAERLAEECLAAIAARQPELNAFITVTADEALAEARAADQAMAAGRPLGPLHGIPMSLKDLIDQAGVATTAGSRVRMAHRAAGDAPVTARLRAAGAVFVGKANLHEFAFGTTSDDSGYGAARNPFDPSRSPGGSSGGSAIAVATGMSVASVGTDTGGSIRIPSAACGVTGLKPGWGEVPAAGVVPLSRQLDHVGPLARSVRDAWLLYDVMCGRAAGTGGAAGGPRGLRVGVPRGYLWDRLDTDVEARVSEALETLASAGARVVEVDIPHAAATPLAYLPLVVSDGAEYHAATLDTVPDAYTANVRFRFEMGRYILAEDYVRAQRLRARLLHEVNQALADVDVLALPALAIPAPPIGAVSMPVRGGEEPVRAVMLRCTQLFNMTGHPAMSLPCGRTRDGLPVGLQLVGHAGGTTRLLSQALGVEAALAR
ncbi:MAG: amidase [Vicinamibacterales bacterium]